jgi:hypothetical protein
MARRIALAALVLVLAACSAPEKGTVYGRWFYPAHDWVQMTCSIYNSNGTCRMQIPTIQHEPARWQLGLRDGEEEGRREVTQHEYESCANGEHYPGC